MYEPKRGEPFYLSLQYMHFMRLYPFPENQKNLKSFTIGSLLVRIVCSFLVIECGLHGFMTKKDHIPIDISEDIVGVSASFNSFVITVLFLIYVKTWSRLFIDIIDTSKFGVPPTITQVGKRNRLFSIIYLSYFNLGAPIYVYALIFLESDHCKKLNEEKGIHEICGTVTPVWWPYDEMGFLTKWFINLYLAICIVVTIPPASLSICLVWESTTFIVSKIHHLKDLFEKSCNTEHSDVARKRIKFCIQYHQDIIRMVTEFNRIHKSQYGQMSFISALILSSISNQLLKRYSLGALVHLGGYLCVVILLCRIGQKIEDETYDIQDALYASKWYQTDPELAKDIQFVMIRCQKPLTMEAIPLGCFNHGLLIIIMKTTYSYLTLMNANNE